MDYKLILSCLLLAGLAIGWLAVIINALQVKHQHAQGAVRFRYHSNERKDDGFSLIELLATICIILIIAAIAIPSLLSSQQRARAASAVGSLKAIHSAETSFMLNYSTYSPSLVVLGDSANPACVPSPTAGTCQIDGFLAAGYKAGYVFTYIQQASGQDYSLNADPAPGQSGTHFYSDASSIIHYSPTTASVTDPVLQ